MAWNQVLAISECQVKDIWFYWTGDGEGEKASEERCDVIRGMH